MRKASEMTVQTTTNQGYPAMCSRAVTYQPKRADIRSPIMFWVLSPSYCPLVPLLSLYNWITHSLFSMISWTSSPNKARTAPTSHTHHQA